MERSTHVRSHQRLVDVSSHTALHVLHERGHRRVGLHTQASASSSVVQRLQEVIREGLTLSSAGEHCAVFRYGLNDVPTI